MGGEGYLRPFGLPDIQDGLSTGPKIHRNGKAFIFPLEFPLEAITEPVKKVQRIQQSAGRSGLSWQTYGPGILVGQRRDS